MYSLALSRVAFLFGTDLVRGAKTYVRIIQIIGWGRFYICPKNLGPEVLKNYSESTISSETLPRPVVLRILQIGVNDVQ